MPLDRRTGGDCAPAGEVRNMDSWSAYNVPRERLLASLSGLRNAVVLTGDEHQNFASELRRDAGRGEAVAVEFVTTSISSGGDVADARAGADRIMAENPFLKWSNDRRSYLICEVTPDEWRSHFRTVDRVTVAGSPVRTAATFTVAHGTPHLRRV